MTARRFRTPLLVIAALLIVARLSLGAVGAWDSMSSVLAGYVQTATLAAYSTTVEMGTAITSALTTFKGTANEYTAAQTIRLPYVLHTGVAPDGSPGLDDLSTAGTVCTGGDYSASYRITYKVEIDTTPAAPGPDTYKWFRSPDSGVTWSAALATEQPIPSGGGTITLENDVTAVFGASTGHTVGDAWTWTYRVNPTTAYRVSYGTSGAMHTELSGESFGLDGPENKGVWLYPGELRLVQTGGERFQHLVGADSYTIVTEKAGTVRVKGSAFGTSESFTVTQDSTTVTVDFHSGNSAIVEMDGSNAITTLDCQHIYEPFVYSIKFVQGGTAKAVTLPNTWLWESGTNGTITETAGVKTLLILRRSGDDIIAATLENLGT